MSSKAASRYLQHLQQRKQQQRRSRAGLVTNATRYGTSSKPSLPTVPEPATRRVSTSSETWSSDEPQNESIATRSAQLYFEDDFIEDPYRAKSPADDDSFLQMIDETAQRWSSAAEVQAITNTNPDQIIQAQQQEIQRLQALLSGQHQVPITTIEKVESIPFEQIEVDTDHLSITSGLTHLHLDNTFDDDNISLHRPDASVAAEEDFVPQRKAPAPHLPPSGHHRRSHSFGIDATPSHKRNNSYTEVRNLPVNLVASDGSIRKASYTGTAKHNLPHGSGTLFLENGDIYQGEMMRGEMHGRGSYTFKQKRRNTQRVLRGTFEHNIFIG